jgi:hypothetical protein
MVTVLPQKQKTYTNNKYCKVTVLPQQQKTHRKTGTG